MEQVDLVDVSHDQGRANRLEGTVIDLRFDDASTDAVDLGERIELGFGDEAEQLRLRLENSVIDLRDDHAPTVRFADGDRVLLFDEAAAEIDFAEGDAVDLTMPTTNMWTRPDTCLAVLVNRARFRQGGIAAVSKDRTDLTELAVLSSRGGDVDARRLARLARGCR